MACTWPWSCQNATVLSVCMGQFCRGLVAFADALSLGSKMLSLTRHVFACNVVQSTQSAFAQSRVLLGKCNQFLALARTYGKGMCSPDASGLTPDARVCAAIADTHHALTLTHLIGERAVPDCMVYKSVCARVHCRCCHAHALTNSRTPTRRGSAAGINAHPAYDKKD